VVGSLNVTCLAILHLKQSPATSFVIMSSLSGRFGYPNRNPYGEAKAGLISLVKTLAIKLGDEGIHVNAITLGAVGRQRLFS